MGIIEPEDAPSNPDPPNPEAEFPQEDMGVRAIRAIKLFRAS